MDRKATRGAKPKNVPLPGNLITLGNKSASRNDGDKSTAYTMSKSAGGSREGGRDVAGSSGLHGKKPGGIKSGGYIMGLARPGGINKPPHGEVVNVLSEEWENVAEEVDTSELVLFVDAAEAEEDYERTEAILCGAVRTLRTQRAKPDTQLLIHLCGLAKQRPFMFTRSNLITEAFCSLLKRDHSMTFKTKGNPTVAVMACNILLAVYQEERNWPEIFIRVYIEDSLGERIWVDHEDSKGFVDNIITAFKTKMPPKTLLFPDLAIGNRPECPSPPISSGSGGGELGDGDSEISLECKESLDVLVCNRYSTIATEVEELVMETVHHQLSLRHQNVDSVARNFIRFLSSVSGIMEVRRIVTSKLEVWLQSPKLQRPATELLMAVCLNCNTHTHADVETIGLMIRFRLKHKPLINQYMACLKELLSAHPDNIHSAIKHTIYNELSQSRNPSNMTILSVIFQFAPEHSAIILAEEFLELFCNKEDFHRALRILFREIVRGLRYDMQFQKFCQGLMKERKDPILRDNFEICERMFYGVTDLIVMVMFVAISPGVRENASLMFRGEYRDVDSVRRYQDLVASIQQDALHWMHRIVPKCYAPAKEEYVRALHKLLMMDQPESYTIKDNYPSENDRPLYFKLASEVPLKQDTLTRLLMIAVTKEQWVKPQDLIELADKLIKRATSLQMEDVEVFHVDDTKIIDLIFNLSLYIPPENTQIPQGYRPPKMAIIVPYWKACTMLLLVTAHNPGVFGRIAWESYPTLRMLMEMCITNSFVFPPPTLLAVGEKAEEMINQEHMLLAKDKEIILEFEEYLAQKSINEQNSLLLSQLMSMEPTGPARKPPPGVLEQLKSLNNSHRVGHLFCRSRNPDFLIDIITRQGTSQSMPWLAELVQSHENAFSMLPVQCLCEFLLSEASGGAVGDSMKHHQLVHHLRTLLRAPPQAATSSSSLEILEYFLRRLSWQQAGARHQAVRGLQRLLHPLQETEGKPVDPHAWLIHHLTALPGFTQVRSMANSAIRTAIQVETEPGVVSAYLRFLAVHTNDDALQEQAGLVSDLAQVIVERCTICNAMLPMPERVNHFVHANSTLKAFFIIFINYMRVVKVPASTFSWSDNQDQVRVQWSNGEQAIMHILVIHAIVILLTFGPNSCSELFHELMSIWFPEQMPQAFLVDTSEEALLFPDWLKLRMIRSTVPRLVDAAVKDLEPNQLVLFIQSFGIPVASMSRLLAALDAAVACSLPAVQDAVLDKSHKAYMAQLLEVQHSRGAVGGEAFAEVLGGGGRKAAADAATTTATRRSRRRPPPLLQPLKVYAAAPLDITVAEVRSFIQQCFTVTTIHHHHRPSISETNLALQRHISREMTATTASTAATATSHALPLRPTRPYTTELCDAITHCLQHRATCALFLKGLHTHYDLSAPLFRLLLQLTRQKEPSHQLRPLLTIVASLLQLDHDGSFSATPLTAVLKMFPVNEAPAQYEPESSSFSIANLAKSSGAVRPTEGTITRVAPPGSSTAGPSGLFVKCDINNEGDVLCSLMATPMHALEKHIRVLVEMAIECGKLGVVRAAFSRLLIVTSTGQEENKLPRRSIALLLDWLQVIDPELQENPIQLRQMLLFAKYKGQPLGIGLGGYSQAYLLGAFTQQANWVTLEETVTCLLDKFDRSLNPGGVLDFVWAVMRVPKLWQGRERRTPRHAKAPQLLKLEPNHLLILAQYILEERRELEVNPSDVNCVTAASALQERMPLLLQCYGDEKPLYATLVEQLSRSAVAAVDCPERRASRSLLYQLYLRRPCILANICPEGVKILPVIAASNASCKSDTGVEHGDGESSADVAIHCLLTMICTPDTGRDFMKRLHELEAALRTLASCHPLLLLRHFHLFYSGLDGLSHLHLMVLKGNNHLEVLNIIAGILQLLHPHLFSPHHNKALTATMNCYMDIFERHCNNPDFSQEHIIVRISDLLQAWLATDRPRALAYLVPKTELLNSLSQQSKLWRCLAVAAASAPTIPIEPSSEDLTANALPLPQPRANWFNNEADEIAMRLSRARPGEEQVEDWQRLEYLAGRAPMELVMKRFLNSISGGVHSSQESVRSLAWCLLARVLLHKPSLASLFGPAVINAVQSEQCAVARSACDHLPDVVLMLHSFAPDLLTAAFVAVTTKAPTSLPALTKALTLLTMHTGA